MCCEFDCLKGVRKVPTDWLGFFFDEQSVPTSRLNGFFCFAQLSNTLISNVMCIMRTNMDPVHAPLLQCKK